MSTISVSHTRVRRHESSMITRHYAGMNAQSLINFRQFEHVFVPRGGLLLSQGGTSNYVFYILNGWVVEESVSRQGDIAWVDVFMKGDFAGLNCIAISSCAKVDAQTATASLQALTDVSVLKIPRNKIGSAHIDDPELNFELLQILKAQSKWYHSRMIALSASSSITRVYHLLKAMFRRALDCGALRPAERLPLSQVVVSHMANISVVHMNRIAQKLRREGLFDWNYEGVQMVEDICDDDW
jgi:CRP-like cAMP-binding protein